MNWLLSVHAFVVVHYPDNAIILAPIKFQVLEFFSSSIPSEILCSPSDGLCSPSPLVEFFSMSLGENMFNIMCKGKCSFHILEGTT